MVRNGIRDVKEIEKKKGKCENDDDVRWVKKCEE